ncbi:MAG TPA: LysR family transcriptional regulator [Methylotenera sp.]|nr:LysR family transcriptional regulator [Methylotenera sp.]HPH05243.1 LysR family transcriptional regulator [Methylotenera sp.]HPN00145.1 LysR family transcriptional regulator [Methylotenera sp.]
MTLKLSIEALEVMDAIDRKGSFAAAADSLYRVPSALTYTVRKLEEDLGVLLFDRTGHRARLTDAGAELLNEGRHLLEAAQLLESRVKRVATGVETNITIAMSDLFNMQAIYQVLQHFYAQGFGTRVKLTREVFGGSWDAIISGRADISIGTPGETPSGSGFSSQLLGQIEFVFAVAPHHPLATLNTALDPKDIVKYRAVAAADSSRNLPPRTSGILTGQDVLTVSNMQEKLQAQMAGLGVGYLPKKLADYYAQQGLLVIKTVTEPKPEVLCQLAWRSKGGKAQLWLVKALQKCTLNDFL